MNDSDRQVLLEGISQLKESADELWAVLDLPDELRVLLTDLYGWSVLLLKDYLHDRLGRDPDQIDWLALKIAGIQAMLRDREEMIRACDLGVWPPPTQKVPECSLAREYRLLREAKERVLPPVSAAQSMDAPPLDWEKQKKRQLDDRRAANGSVSPSWALCFKSPGITLPPRKQSSVVRLLMKHLSLSVSEATNALSKLLAGEHLATQLARRADWYPLRESLRKSGVTADLAATYPTSDSSICKQTELTELTEEVRHQ